MVLLPFALSVAGVVLGWVSFFALKDRSIFLLIVTSLLTIWLLFALMLEGLEFIL